MKPGSKTETKSIICLIFWLPFRDLSRRSIFYAPPLARRPACTLRMYTLLRMLAPCFASALSRYHPGWDPTPREPHPRDPPPPPPPPTPPTPPHPNHPPVRVEGYSEWMAIPSGWLFRVHGYSEGSYFNSTQGRAQTQSMQKALTASVGSLYLLSGHNAAPLVRITRSTQEHPKSTRATRRPTNTQELPRSTQEHPGAHQEHPRAPRSTHEHPGALEPV